MALTAPQVTNVRATQRPGTKIVDIYYNLSAPAPVRVIVAVSINGGADFGFPVASLSGAYGPAVAPGNDRHVEWNAGIDLPNWLSTQMRVRIIADDGGSGSMALIPAGSFTMGDTFSEGWDEELPLHTVYVSAFYMDKYEVTKALWDTVKAWATANGYQFDNAGSGKAANHPVHSVNWFDMVKWCNARSQQEGRTPCYYTDASLTQVYKTGQVASNVKWNANGYRLPTEAEWEKAARGGVSGRRFPWSHTDNITHSLANYYSTTDYGYDTSPTRRNHPTFNDGVSPFTSPVGYFAPNGYGLYDMAGNVWEWCWDWHQSNWYGQTGATQNDTRGPASGDYRVLRGGSWGHYAVLSRCAHRYGYTPTDAYGVYGNGVGFRCVRGL